MTAVAILKGISLFQTLAPALLQLVSNYRTIIDNGEVTEEDKAAAKELFESVKLRDWEDL